MIKFVKFFSNQYNRFSFHVQFFFRLCPTVNLLFIDPQPLYSSLSISSDRLTASDIMEPNLTYVYPHTRVQSLVSILRTTAYHAFPVVTENRPNERDFMKGNILVSNNIHFKVGHLGSTLWSFDAVDILGTFFFMCCVLMVFLMF